jgi:hypothetical protein
MEEEKDLIFACNDDGIIYYNIYKISKNKYYVLISNMIEEYFTTEEESFNFIKSYIQKNILYCEENFEENINDYKKRNILDDIFYCRKMITL